ncbi:MAG: HAMP domain-containing sensor histidine kinase [Chitinophagaceae bacterium]
MTIRLRLTLLFTILIASILAVFACAIYFAYAFNREEEYYKRLKQQAITKAKLLFDVKISPGVLQQIQAYSSNGLHREEVAIFDTANHLLYHDAVERDKVKETPAMMREILSKKEIHFLQGDQQAIGILYIQGGKPYIITAAALDTIGLAKQQTLLYILIVSFLFAVALTARVAVFFSRKALQPVSDMVDQAAEISARHLDLRLQAGNGKDELAELAATFNKMLDRLEQSFDAQKQFVSNISHELRTPLSAIITELELALSQYRTEADYKHAISLALADAKRLARLSNGLLDIAKASYDESEIIFRTLRIDELLLDARQFVLKSNADYHIDLHFAGNTEEPETPECSGNEYLLRVAFINLLENACKFSEDHRCLVSISQTGNALEISFSDRGIGIPPQDIPKLSQTFFRGQNGHYAQGSGIGLSLTYKIIGLHKGSIDIKSTPGAGTCFTVYIPNS